MNTLSRHEDIHTIRIFPVPQSELWGVSQDYGATMVQHSKVPGRASAVAEADRLFAEDGCVPLERKPTEKQRTIEPASFVTEIGFTAPGDWGEVSCHGHLSLDYLIVVVLTTGEESIAVLVDTEQEFDQQLKLFAYGLAGSCAVYYVERKLVTEPRGRIIEHDWLPDVDYPVNLKDFWEDVRAAQERAIRTNRLLEYRIEGDREDAFFTVNARDALGTYCRRTMQGEPEVRLYVEFILPGQLTLFDDDCLIGASL